jgi:hypothetical protein
MEALYEKKYLYSISPEVWQVICDGVDFLDDDEDEVALFINKFNKFIKKRIPYKGERKEKPTSKRVCYNCDKNEYFIAQCPYES